MDNIEATDLITSDSTLDIDLEGNNIEELSGLVVQDPESRSISGYNWNDLDGDGVWDEDEEGLEGWTIYIDDNKNGELDEGEISVITAEDGSYSFSDLSPGTYTIAEVFQPGWEQTYPGFGDVEGEISIRSSSSLSSSQADSQEISGRSDTENLAADGSEASASESDTNTTESSRDPETPIEAAFEEREVIVKVASDKNINALESLKAELGVTTIKTTQTLDLELWEINIPVEEAILRYGNDDRIEYIEPNYTITVDSTIPNDPSFNQLWGLHNTGQSGGTADADIDAPEAWDIQTGSNNVVVGVIDTGIDYTHPDLVDNMWTNPGEIPDDGIDNDGNGYVDDVYGYDFANGDSNPFDGHSHGTHVAGTIAANGDNGQGVVGVNWDADLMALKFLSDSGSGSTFNAILAVEYATMMGADLTNNSWGGGGFSQGLYNAIAKAGEADSLFIAAAGNSNNNNDNSPHYPSSYDLDNIISVASTDRNDNKSGFSSYGATSVDLGAPGSSIYSTVPGGGYGFKSGTSMATPHVAGVAALMLAENPNLSHEEVKEIILETTDPISALDGKTLTGGRLNAFNALSSLEEPEVPGTHTVELGAGEDVTDINFGNRNLTPETGSISGYKWHDLDGNSEWDDSEPVLEGLTIYIDENENGELDEGETSTVTNAEGYYEFDGLDAGTYVIGEIIPEGWKQTYPDSIMPEEAEAETSELSQSSIASEERDQENREIPIEAAFESGQVIVKASENAEVGSLNSLKASLGATTINTTQNLGIELWSIEGNVEDVIARSRKNPLLEYIEPNYTITVDSTVPNDPSFNQLWGLNNTGQTGGTADADIDAPEAWDIQTGSSNVVVGVIDSGIDYTHPDLADNMWTNPGEIAGNGIDDDGNGYVDDVYGYDFVNSDGDPFDDNNHGTHVAGTIGANGDDGQGIVGVNWDADLMALKFLDNNGSGSLFNAVLAIEYATEMGADLTNNSWGGGGFSQSLYDAITAAGAADSLFVAAAGNSNNNNDVSASYPASYDLDNIISVASTDHNDNKSSFSNYGATSVDLGAPGSSIYSTVPGGGYASFNGTSMATPHVAGVAALVLAENPDLSYQEVKDIILDSTDPISALDGKTLTGGRLNAFNALSSIGVPGTHTVQLDAGENVTDINFGNQEILSGSISGNNWHDLDEDGIWDDNEDGLAGWTIYIDDNENGELDEGELSTVTDENGFYIFEDLEPETSYIVAEVIADGWEQTYPGTMSEVVFEADFSDDDGNPDLDGFTVDNTGASNEGLWHLSTRRGDEPGHSGVDSMYYGVEEDGNYDAGDTAGRIISPVIDLSGLESAQLSFNYFLETEGLAPNYDAATVLISENGGDFLPIASNAVELEDPTTGWTNATFDLSSYVGEEIEISFEFDTVDSIANQYEGWLVDDVIVGTVEGDLYHTVEVGNGENVEDIDFGNRNLTPETGSISGYKWHDLNGNSEWDDDEPVLEGLTIYIDENENGEFDEGEISTVTDVEGYYEFDSLDAGTYVIGEVIPEGWKQTYPDSITPEEAEAETLELGVPGTHTVELEAGEDVSDINFGNQEILPGSISGNNWHDLDEDGIWDENEEGLEGWTIYIDENENGELDEGELSTVTDENGFYIFEDLDPETYIVAEVIEDGWEQTYPGTTSEVVGSELYHTVEVGNGENVEDIDFGNFSLEPELPLTIIEDDGTAAFAKHSEDNTYWIVKNDTQEQLQLQNKKGKTYTDSTNSKWDGVAVEVDGEGGYRFLLDGANNREGRAYVWFTNDQGVINGNSGWLSGNDLLPIESEFNVDLNNDGEIGGEPGLKIIEDDGTAAFAKNSEDNTYWIVNNDTQEELQLQNSKGKAYNDSTNSTWDGVAVEVDEEGGYRFLLDGENKREGQGYVWFTDDQGVINGNSGWLSGNKLLPIELEFNVDLNDDGEIGGELEGTIVEDEDTASFVKDSVNGSYWIVNNDTQEQLQLQNSKGKSYTDSKNSTWDGVAVEVDEEGGYRFLLDGENNKEGQGYVWYTDDQGVINGNSGWLSGDNLLPLESEFNVDLNDDGIIGSSQNLEENELLSVDETLVSLSSGDSILF